MENNVETTAIVSGIWLSFRTLGGMIGPLLGGKIYETIGFQNTTIIFMGLEGIMFILALIYIINNKNYLINKRKVNEGGDKIVNETASGHDNASFTQ